MKKTKTLKVTVLVLLTSAILLAAIPLLNVAAQTQDSLYVYSSIGGTISTGGQDLTGGSSYNYADGSTVSFLATPDAGFQFLGWVLVSASNQTTSTANPYPLTFSASGALQALFTPITNATQTTSTTGSSIVIILNSAGGTTEPAAGSYSTYKIGDTINLKADAGTGFKFLYWIIATSTNTMYTSSSVVYQLSGDTCALQAFFVPNSSDLSVTAPTPTPVPSPTIPEYSGATAGIIALALVAVAFGTYTYRRKAKQ